MGKNNNKKKKEKMRLKGRSQIYKQVPETKVENLNQRSVNRGWMPSFKVLFKGVEMIKNHCSGIHSNAIELFIATKAMLTLNNILI